MAELFADNNIDLFTSFVRWLYGQAHLFFYKCNLSIVIDTSSNNAHCLNSWNYLHKSGDNRVTWYCRTQKISQMWFFGFEKLPRLLAVRSKYPSERKNLTQQLNHYCWLESRVFVNTFTSTTLSNMIRFWICKDQNDSLHTAQHAKPLGGHIWSHFD